jgi:hypothetical protein
MNSEKTYWGFPRGKVAKTLRSVLSKEFTDDDINTIAVVLMSHSLIEAAIERLLYLVLDSEFPHYGRGLNAEETKKFEDLNTKMEESLSKRIQNMSFWQKFSLIKPYLEIWYPYLVEKIEKINPVRNKIAHLEKIHDLKFEEKLIWSEEGLEEFFVSTQCVAKEIDKLWEMIDDKHALYEKCAKRLRELGESLI